MARNVATSPSASRPMASPRPTTRRPTVSTASSKRAGMTWARMSATPRARAAPAEAAKARCSCAYRRRTAARASARSVPARRSASGGPPSGSSSQPRLRSTAIGASTCSGTTRLSSSLSPASNAVAGPVALSQTGPAVVGVVKTVAHGRRCGCSTGSVRRIPALASCASSQPVAVARHRADPQTSAPVPPVGPDRAGFLWDSALGAAAAAPQMPALLFRTSMLIFSPAVSAGIGRPSCPRATDLKAALTRIAGPLVW